MKNKIILINGPMAAGKSTICSALYEMLDNFVFVDRAYIKDMMLKRVKKQDKSFARKVSKEATYLIAKYLMEQKYNLILQELSYDSMIKHIGDHVKKYDYEVHGFYLYCSLETSKKRDFQRKGFDRSDVVESIYNEFVLSEIERNKKYWNIIDTEKNDVEQILYFIINNLKK